MSRSETKRYVIKTVEDLFNIPPEKLADCLEDLYAWIIFVNKFDDDIKDMFGGKVEKAQFEWVSGFKDDLHMKRSKRDMN